MGYCHCIGLDKERANPWSTNGFAREENEEKTWSNYYCTVLRLRKGKHSHYKVAKRLQTSKRFLIASSSEESGCIPGRILPFSII